MSDSETGSTNEAAPDTLRLPYPPVFPEGVRVLGTDVDSLYLSYRFSLATGVEEELDWRKAAAARKPKEKIHPLTGEILIVPPPPDVWVSVGNTVLEVRPNGSSSAPYLLHGADIHVSISPRGELAPTMQVQCLSAALWREGAAALVAQADSVAAELARGGVWDERFVSRIDLAVDYQGFVPSTRHFDYFVSAGNPTIKPFAKDHLIDGGLDKNLWWRTEIEGFQFGHGAVSARMYDKSAEIKKGQNAKSWFLNIWDRSGQRAPEEATWRLENQFRREYLRTARMGKEKRPLETIEDVLERRGDLWRYATQDWLRLTLLDTARKSNATVDPRWQTLSDVEAFDYAPRCCVSREEQLNANAEAKVAAIRGYVAAYGACSGHTTMDDTLLSLPAAFKKYSDLRGVTDNEAIERQRKRYGVAGVSEHGSVEKLRKSHRKSGGRSRPEVSG